MKITDIKQQVKQAGRYSIFVDGKYSFSLSADALLESGLVAGQELDQPALADLKRASSDDKAYNNALRYVAIRPRSEWELATYLRRKQVGEEAASNIFARLRDFGYVDDAAFARSWVENRRLLKSVSKRRLRQELQQKHVAEDVISGILEEDETDDRTALRALIAKKRARYPDQQKLMQYLARQGFSYEDIKSTLSESG